jgi:hypothetical protein
MSQKYLLRMNIPPSLEEEFMDALLANREVQGYQTWHTSGHGQVGAMSITEQVAGRRNRVLFEVVLDESTLATVLASLKATLPISDIIYWVLPVTASGRFSDSDQ